ncbi:DUF6209 family protein [Archangium primigenium]|uniref:DUF6209 family protein n=1 Tax=[Archangium] primigenium TaxID=2792470 RepID=UPI00195E5A30|nr:DUF6209 family protein [Archangium primigenium]MBM7116649.1 hypothetical protein [Archangium primigenium]
MISRHGLGKSATIYFTCTWSQRLEGELKPGGKLGLYYDPHRMPLAPDYLFGMPGQPITVHVRFSEKGPVQSKVLWSRSGILRHVEKDPTGHGAMLLQEFVVPADAEELRVWFDYRGSDGQVHYDSDYGRDYRFRFVTRDLRVHPVPPSEHGASRQLRLAVNPEATQVRVRYRVLEKGVPGQVREAPLTDTGARDPEGGHIWLLPHAVLPSAVPVVFDLAYQLGGRTYVDDNSGRHFRKD